MAKKSAKTAATTKKSAAKSTKTTAESSPATSASQNVGTPEKSVEEIKAPQVQKQAPESATAKKPAKQKQSPESATAETPAKQKESPEPPTTKTSAKQKQAPESATTKTSAKQKQSPEPVAEKIPAEQKQATEPATAKKPAKQKQATEPATAKTSAKQKQATEPASAKKPAKQKQSPEIASAATVKAPKANVGKATNKGKTVPVEVAENLRTKKKAAPKPIEEEFSETAAMPAESPKPPKTTTKKKSKKVALAPEIAPVPELTPVPVAVEAIDEQQSTETPEQLPSENLTDIPWAQTPYQLPSENLTDIPWAQTPDQLPSENLTDIPPAPETPNQSPEVKPEKRTMDFAFLSRIKPTELHLEKGAALYTAGDDCKRAYFVKKGGFSVTIPNKNGSGVMLYHVGAGEVCVLSVVASMARSKHRVTATLSEVTDILAVPTEKLAALLDSDAEARAVIYSQMAERLTDALTTLEEVAFRRKDIRLATALCRKISHENLTWPGTIADLAEIIDASAEVLQLILQQFQQEGLLVVEHGTITVTNRPALIIKSME